MGRVPIVVMHDAWNGQGQARVDLIVLGYDYYTEKSLSDDLWLGVASTDSVFIPLDRQKND